ncbi:MAG: STAS domain-containing protein [Anaerolineales bacterium]|nr:MAG: STAS domain-containing protein [Anaerolineales bacterium]
MEITQRTIGEEMCVISLDGTLNARSAEQVKDAFREVAGKGIRQVILDLGNVPFIDSSGLAAMVSGLKTLNEKDGSLKLASLQSQADLLFKLTMFDKVFELFSDVDSAIQSFES